jgi:cytochrome c553
MKSTILVAAVVALFGIANAAQAAGDVAAGKAKAKACAGCHGANGEGVKPNPALAGKSEDELVQAMKDYKSGKRANPVMKSMVASLSDQDMANVAAYFASLKK